jgi:hypothetical protein
MESKLGLQAKNEVIVGDKAFGTADKVITYLESIDENERYGAQCEVLEKMAKYHQRVKDLTEKTFEYV